MRVDFLLENPQAMGSLDEASIFQNACQIETPESRREYVQQACGGNRVLLSRVEALLRVFDGNPDFLESPAEELQGAGQVVVSEGVGSQIGPYKLVELIGEGGFGVVFMAEQRQPVRRTVALKILKPGMDTRQVVARFEAERQALALMEHPNLAHVLDGGQTPTGRPYFVMDLVKGVPITNYCDEHQLTPRERLALFIPVCRAIQHAHQKGIIHRDLKPTNVLIAAYDGQPVPKVIDFGVAKAMGQPLTERTLVTGFGGIVGTLEYMSPEQAEFNARDVDTRADIYSLGVLLYELLTGTTPLTRERLKESATPEVLRLIREEEPPKPSTRLSELCRVPSSPGTRTSEESSPALWSSPSLASISAQRKLEPTRLTRELRGELDWIVMKALEKDRDRRYQTANGLARDIQRYLNDEPVEACPPSAGYKLRKFTRTYRKFLTVAGAFAILLTAGTVVSLWQAIRATQAEQAIGTERDRAEAEAKRAQRHVFAAHMNLALSAYEGARMKRVIDLLELHRPQLGEEDLRGFEWHYLMRLTDTALFTLRGHRGLVSSVAFSPDGKKLASAGEDGQIKMWDLASGRCFPEFEGHKQWATSVAFSPDGKQLASASYDGTVKLWDTASGRKIRTLDGHSKKWVVSVAFSPDGKRLASGASDNTVKLWDPADGRVTHTLIGHNHHVVSVAFSPDGARLASGSHDRTIIIWDLVGGHSPIHLRGHTDSAVSVAFSPDGRRLASASADRKVKLWDVASGSCIRTLWGHTDRVYAVAFSPDGKKLASGSWDQTIRMWDPDSGEETMSLKGHTSWIASIAFSPDGSRLASASHDETVKVWDTTVGEDAAIVIRESNVLKCAVFSPDGKRLASTGHDPGIMIRDADSGREIRTLYGHTGTVFGLAYDPTGDRLASVSQDKTVKLWDANSGRVIRTLKGPTEGFARLGCVVAFSPDGQRLAAGGENHSVMVWDASDGRELLTLHGHTSVVTSVAFSPQREQGLLASASADGKIKLWDAVTGRMIFTLSGHRDAVNSVTFSPDGSRLASASGDMTVRVWDVDHGQEIMSPLTGHTYAVYSVAFSPDGKRLASASADKMVKLWDMTSGQETLNLKGHTSGVPSVVFSPDGWRLASAGYDGTMRVWDARPWTSQLRIEKQARDLINVFRAKGGRLKPEVIQRIEQDRSLNPALRQEALAMTQRWQEDPLRLNKLSWGVVVGTNATAEDYDLALRRARAACNLEPNNGMYVNTLGAAQYRNGQFQEALDTLTRSDEINASSGSGPRPEDVAFLAMTHFKLGEQGQARVLLDDLRRLMNKSRWSRDPQNHALLREATVLIDSQQ